LPGSHRKNNSDELEAADEHHEEVMARLEELRRKHMAEWEYLRSDEYKQSVRDELISRTHEPITPPWEE
jgi:hypothetical protein